MPLLTQVERGQPNTESGYKNALKFRPNTPGMAEERVMYFPNYAPITKWVSLHQFYSQSVQSCFDFFMGQLPRRFC